jgi:hypothetical protein
MNNSMTYNTQLRFLIRTGGIPDGRTQKIAVRVDGGDWSYSDANADMFSVSGMLANNAATIFRPAVLAYGTHTVATKAINDSGSSTEVARTFTVAVLPFIEVVQYVSVVTAAQVNTLHSGVNHVRAFYGISNMRWTEPIISGKTLIRDWPLHIAELRSGVEGIVYTVNAFDAEDSFDIPLPTWTQLNSGYPQANAMNQLAQVIQSL